MVDVAEGQLTFHFNDEWSTLKYDDSSFYRSVISRLPITMKAMDIVACNNQEQHIWFEIKDCLGFEIDNQPRLSPTEHQSIGYAKQILEHNNLHLEVVVKRKKLYLPDEIIQKLGGTLIGIIISKHKNEAGFAEFHSVLFTGKLRVIVFLALGYPQRDYNLLADRLERDIRRRLNKLTQMFLPNTEADVIVCNENTIPPGSEWSVTRTPASTQPV